MSSPPYVRQAKILERITTLFAWDAVPLNISQRDCDVRATNVGDVLEVTPTCPSLLHPW